MMSSCTLFAQRPTVDAMRFRVHPPPQVPALQSVIIGAPGTAVAFYWLTVNYPEGETNAPSNVEITNIPSPLSPSNYIQLGWREQSGAISYNVYKTANSNYPSGGSDLLCHDVITNNCNDTGQALTVGDPPTRVLPDGITFEVNSTGSLSPTNISTAVAYPSVGTDACQQIQNAIANLPANGGIVDARNLVGAQQPCAAGENIVLGSTTKPIELVLGASTLNLGANAINVFSGDVVSGLRNASVINYSGAGTMIQAPAGAVDVIITGVTLNETNLGTGTGINLNWVYRSTVSKNTISGFAIGIYLNATVPNNAGVYYDTVSQNDISCSLTGNTACASAIGIQLSNSSATQSVNRNSLRDNWVNGESTCIAASGVSPYPSLNIIEGNDCESPIAASDTAISLEASNTFVLENWIEGYTTGTDITDDLAGSSGNSFYANYYGAAATRLNSIPGGGDEIIEPQLEFLQLQSTVGNVGIGTTTPEAPLVVSNSGAQGIEFFPDNLTFGTMIQSYNRSAAAYDKLDFNALNYGFRLSSAAADTVTIAASGDVGIGTASPAQTLDINGNVAISGVLVDSNTAPTLSGFGTSPSIVASSGTAGFEINVGTGGTAASGLLTFPAATHGWAVSCSDITTQTSSVFVTKQISSTPTTATIAQFSDAGAETAWAAGDILVCQARAF